MPVFAIPFPMIDPVAVQLGPLAIKWYGLAYVVGLLGGWWYARRLVATERLWGGLARPRPEELDDMLLFVAFGVVLGGRTGFVLFYDLPRYLERPQDIIAIWQGGMSFHGGLIGATLGLWTFARRRGYPALSVFDLAAAVVPMIRGSVVVDGSAVPLLGSDQRVTQLSGSLRGALRQGQAGTGPGTVDLDRLRTGVFVGPGLGLDRGDRLTVNGIEVEVLEVVGNEQAAGLNNGRFLFAYVDLAQRLVGLEGRLDSILIVTEPGADLSAVRSQLQGIVDGRAVVVDPDFRAKQAEVASSVTRDATLLVSLVSLVIAAFLVFNTMNMAVASRRRSLAMIRALGAKRSHLVGDMLGEAALMGFVGGVLGIPLGILAGRAVISSLPEPPADSVGTVINYHLPGYAPAAAVIACVVACVAATTLAARAVFAVSPVEAMAPVEVSDSAARRGPAVVIAAVLALAFPHRRVKRLDPDDF